MGTTRGDQLPGTALVLRTAFIGIGLAVLGACGGGSAAPAVPVASAMQPTVNGFSFPNYPSSSFPDEFNSDDVVSMFGSGEDVCVEGVATPCTLTAEAAAFARLVNQSRASGHCEGLVTVALTRFNEDQAPETVKLPAESETLHTVMRAFATQFLPEVQTEVRNWLGKTMDEKIAALSESFASGKLKYTLGVYTEQGGHAVLPYALEFPSKEIARIMVYDSNWPARNRYVDVDLKKKTWTFSFSGADPATDPKAWTGGENRIELTSIDTRLGKCPFCGDGSAIQKNTLLVRTENLDWSVEVNGEEVSPKSPDTASGQGVVVKPIKGSVQGSGRAVYDYLIEIPRDAATQETTTTTSRTTNRSKLSFSGKTSIFAMTSSGIAQIQTPGNRSIPVEVGDGSIVSRDPNVNLTLASGNLVASASGPGASLEVSSGTLAVTVQAANGQVVEQTVTASNPAAIINADPTSGGVTVLQQSASGQVLRTEVAPDGSEKKSVETTSLNLNSSTFVPPAGLESKPLAELPALSERNLANPAYKPDSAYVVPTTTVPGKVETQSVQQVKPLIGRLSIDSKVFGDAAFSLTEPTSNSAAPFSYSSSDTSVATVNTSTGRVTIVGVGSTTLTATQPATNLYLQGSVTAVLRVAKDVPKLGAFSVSAKVFGDDPFVVKEPTSTSTQDFIFESSDPKIARISSSGRVTILTAGQVVITASQPGNANYELAEKKATLVIAKATTTLDALSVGPKTFGDAEFTVVKPVSNSAAAVVFESSDSKVIEINSATGVAQIAGAGSATISARQAASATHEAGSTSVTVKVDKATPTYRAAVMSGVDTSMTTAEYQAPTSTSRGSFTFASSNDTVATVDKTTGVVTVVGAGTITITATQAATANYLAGTHSTTFTVDKGTPTLGNLIVADQLYGADSFTVTAPTSTSTGTFAFSSTNAAVATVDSSTGVVTIVGVGDTIISASQAATTKFTATSISTTLRVARRNQTPLVLTSTTGVKLVPLALETSGGLGTGAVTFALANAGTAGCSVSGSTLTATDVGTCTVSATKAGDANHLAATMSATTVTILLTDTSCAVTTSTTGIYTVKSFSTVGSCTWTVPAGVTSVEYLVVAGGGGGASGGGGAGGLLTNVGGSAFSVSPSAILNVTVGAGGTAGTGGSSAGNGGDSVFATVTATGGGGGGGASAGLNGGSGGGGGFDRTGVPYSTGVAGQGFGGGITGHGGYGAGGGGGGAGGAGANAAIVHQGGAGGVGVQSSITGVATYFAGGGGGGVNHNCGCSVADGGGAGGLGGGGNGSTLGNGGGSFFDGTSGAPNTGGGGGGTDPESSVAGSGGSGIVIIRYTT